MNDPTKVICPGCVHEFSAIPEDVQAKIERLRAALRDIKDIAFNRASSEVAGNFDACAYNIAKAALEDNDE